MLLLALGADPHTQNEDGASPLLVVALIGSDAELDLLMAAAR